MSSHKDVLPSNTLRVALTGIYTVTTFVGMYLDNVLQPYYRSLEQSGKLDALGQYRLHYFLDYVGDVTNGYAAAGFCLIVDILLSLLATRVPEEKQKTIRRLQKVIPYFLITAFLIAIIEVETPGGFLQVGEPFLLDMPAGFFGILTSALLVDTFTHYHFWSDYKRNRE